MVLDPRPACSQHLSTHRTGSTLIRINKLTDYAMLLLTRLADQSGQLQSAQQLAGAAALELPTASKVLKLLNQAQLLESVRGAHGGYRLAKSADDISVLDVICAIEGPLGITECSIAPGRCDHEGSCGYQGNWQLIEQEIRGLLSRLSLNDMRRPLQLGFVSSGSHPIPIALRNS
jgi:FeS assembly SUF system regulator